MSPKSKTRQKTPTRVKTRVGWDGKVERRLPTHATQARNSIRNSAVRSVESEVNRIQRERHATRGISKGEDGYALAAIQFAIAWGMPTSTMMIVDEVAPIDADIAVERLQ